MHAASTLPSLTCAAQPTPRRAVTNSATLALTPLRCNHRVTGGAQVHGTEPRPLHRRLGARRRQGGTLQTRRHIHVKKPHPRHIHVMHTRGARVWFLESASLPAHRHARTYAPSWCIARAGKQTYRTCRQATLAGCTYRHATTKPSPSYPPPTHTYTLITLIACCTDPRRPRSSCLGCRRRSRTTRCATPASPHPTSGEPSRALERHCVSGARLERVQRLHRRI